MDDLRQALYKVLTTRFGLRRDHLTDDTQLFSSGLIDSLGVIDFVSFIEGEIGKTVPVADITLENFDSISQVVAYTRRLDNTGGSE